MSSTDNVVLEEFTINNGHLAVIRCVQQGDAKKLLDFINPVSKEDTFILLGGERLTIKDETEFVSNALANQQKGDGCYIVCEIGGKIVASSSLTRKTAYKKRALHVADIGIVISKGYRGQGIGHKIMKQLIKHASKMDGIKLLELGVFATNQPAIKLYKKCGFKEIGRMPKQLLHRGKYIDHILMVREVERDFLSHK